MVCARLTFLLLFYRPTEFLPHEYSGIRGIEQKMYKEQEILKMKSHKDIKANYNAYCSKLPTYDAVFFPARVRERERVREKERERGRGKEGEGEGESEGEGEERVRGIALFLVHQSEGIHVT